jgi:hypothetical protein
MVAGLVITAKPRWNGRFSKICDPFDFPLGFDPNQTARASPAIRPTDTGRGAWGFAAIIRFDP